MSSQTAQSLIDTMYATKPLIFGHRGARAYAPMNTLPAFELALKQGADGIELDVHRSKDGYPVIVHDFHVDHTTNGTGLIAEKTLSELKALDAGSWFSPEFTGVQIPTLDEVFEAVGKQLLINVEIKAETLETDGVEQVVVDCIVRHGMAERVLITSFNAPTLVRFRALMPAVPVGYLTEIPYTELPTDATYEAFNPNYRLVTPEMVEACRTRNIRINVWTLNDPQAAVDLAQMGVEGIITDNPDLIVQAIKSKKRAD